MKRLFSKTVLMMMGLIVICSTLMPLSVPVFAWTGGLLDGKSLNIGQNATTVSRTSSLLTDNDLTTYETLTNVGGSTSYYAWYSFPAPTNIAAYQVKANATSSTVSLRFYDSAGNVITTKSSPVINGIFTAYSLNNVSKVAIYPSTSGGSIDLYEVNFYTSLNISQPPAKPTGLTGTPSDGKVVLIWSPNVETDLAGYNVYKNGVKLNSSLILGTTFTATSLLNNTTYYWKITAVNTDGLESVPSDQISTLFDSVSPMAPIGLTAVTGLSQGVVELSWLANTDNASGYNVYQNDSKINTAEVVVPHYTVTGVVNNKTYVFAVTAYNASGVESAKSVPVVYYFDTIPPEMPKNLKAVGGDQKITLTWSANTESDLAGYYVYDSLGNRLNTLLLKTTSYEVVGLGFSETYSFQISAVDLSGNESEKTSFVSATTSDEPDDVPPSTPRGVTVTNGNESAYLTWLPNPEKKLSYYNLYLDGVLFDQIQKNTKPSYTINNLVNDRTYVVQLSAVDIYGNESPKTSDIIVQPSIKSIPPVSMSYILKNVTDVTSNWFSTIWLILAFAIAIPLSFVVGSRVKGMFS